MFAQAVSAGWGVSRLFLPNIGISGVIQAPDPKAGVTCERGFPSVTGKEFVSSVL